MILLNGKRISEEAEITLTKRIQLLKEKLKLAVILVGNNPSSEIYVRMKQERCTKMNIDCQVFKLSENISEHDLSIYIEKINNDVTVTGILVQLPLPQHINTRVILDKVDIKKDVDGLTSYHLMKILLNEEEILPCTPKGVLRLLEEYQIGISGKNICIIGFSDLVGKPLASMCLNQGATVTVCHSKTCNLKQHTLSADILMSAAGVPRLITEDMVKTGVVIVDIGITNHNNKIVGDVDFDKVKDKCSYITPVPYGVGPMTVISLIENLIQLRNKSHQA